MSDGCTYIGNFTEQNPSITGNWDRVIWQTDRLDNFKIINSTQKLVDWLNNPELSQEHRFATQDEVVKVVMYQSSRWRN
jgi:hypothetical protein